MSKRVKIVSEQTEYGSWKVRWTQDGKRRSRTFDSKVRADALCRELNRGIYPKFEEEVRGRPPREDLTFADLSKAFMERHTAVNTESSTYIKYQGMLRNHILPALGEIKVTDLHITDLDGLAAELSTKQRQRGQKDRTVLVVTKDRGEPVEISNKFQYDCMSLALTIANYGFEREYLEINPFQRFKLKRVKAQRIEYLTGDEVEKFMDWCAAGGPYEHKGRRLLTPRLGRDTEIFMTSLHTGMRIGEIRGLKKKNIDFHNGLIWVSEIYDAPFRELAERTKGGNVRCIEMDDEIRAIMEKRRFLDPEAQVFGDIGSPCWLDQGLYAYCNRAGIKPVSFHCFRHTFATAMAKFTPPAILQRILGHESITTTMQYVHIAQSDVIGFTPRIAGLFKAHKPLEELAEKSLSRA